MMELREWGHDVSKWVEEKLEAAKEET